ncbi:hypothetical protein ACH5RR_021166 [Cinchona calisaya]|uniref:Uncharacterized protein n=1 Tax=Cinchona calisaya TaxID=153742 RepID=A0ABD2ZGJ1_9GENT
MCQRFVRDGNGPLASMCKEMCQFRSKVDGGYDSVVKVVQGEIGCLKEKYKKAGAGYHIEPRISDFSKRYGHKMDILDTVFARAKGDHKSSNKSKVKRCGFYR